MFPIKKLPATTIFLLEAVLSSWLMNAIFTASMVYQVTIVHLSPLQLVLVGTVLEASIFLFEVPTGVVADVFSRRLSVIIGYVLIGAGSLLEGSIPRFLPILAAQILWGLGYTFTSGAWQAWIADEVGEEKAGGMFVRGAQFAQIGSLLGILSGMWLGSLRVNFPILAGGGLMVVLALFLALFMPETGFKPTPREERSSWDSLGHTLTDGLQMLRRRPMLKIILWIGLFFGLYSEAYDRLWTPHMLQDFAMPQLQPVVWIGILEIAASVIIIAGTEIARRKLDPDDPRRVIVLLISSTVGILAGLVLFALTRQSTLAVAAVLTIGLARNLNSPYLTAWTNQHLDSQVRATVLSMSSLVDALGQILGGPILGLVGSRLGIRAALIGSALLLSPVIFLFLYARRQQDGLVVVPPDPANVT